MSEIYCRICSEPYSNVGGIHYTHADMTAWHYRQFLQGLGCPCCEGFISDLNTAEALTLEEQEQRSIKWERSILSASDINPPWEGFEAATLSAWREGRWADQVSPLWERLRPREQKELQSIGGDKYELLEREETDILDEYVITFELPHDHFGLTEKDHIRYVNGQTAMNRLIHAKWSASDWSIKVEVARENADGTYIVHMGIIADIYDMLRALVDYPCLDDDLLSTLEAEAIKEAWEETISDTADEVSGVLGCYFKVAQELLERHKDEIGTCERQSDDEFVAVFDDAKLWELIAHHAAAPGWEFYHSTLADVWIAISNPEHKPLDDIIGGILIRGRTAEITYGIRSREFRGELEPYPNSIHEIPAQARIAFLKLLKLG